MTTLRTLPLVLLMPLMLANCRTQIKVKEEDKIFHSGLLSSGLGGIFFGLYKEGKYEFCDGDFINEGCYTGKFSLSGDTIFLHELKDHNGIPTNKFLIRRYSDMDSSYWIWKYPDRKIDWHIMRQSDSLVGSTGDVFPLDEMNKISLVGDNYFLIRLDSLKSNP